jgi:hypothetical protein
LSTEQNLKDILSTYNKNLEINNAQLEEAKRILPKAGYDNSKLYVVPTYGVYQSNGVVSEKLNNPAPPINVVSSSAGAPSTTGTVVYMRNPKYKNPSIGIRVKKETLKSIWDLTADYDISQKIDKFVQTNLEVAEVAPAPLKDVNPGTAMLEGTRVLSVKSMGAITGPYGTADNTYATADANPEAAGFTGTISTQMDWRADCDPAFQFISRASPRSFGYETAYMSGDGTAPNGYPSGAGIAFPQNPQVGDYFLRIDYMPQILYRWDGQLWIRISKNVRTDTGMTADDKSQISTFVNNEAVIYNNNTETVIPSAQPLSSILQLAPDNLPPIE